MSPSLRHTMTRSRARTESRRSYHGWHVAERSASMNELFKSQRNVNSYLAHWAGVVDEANRIKPWNRRYIGLFSGYLRGLANLRWNLVGIQFFSVGLYKTCKFQLYRVPYLRIRELITQAFEILDIWNKKKEVERGNEVLQSIWLCLLSPPTVPSPLLLTFLFFFFFLSGWLILLLIKKEPPRAPQTKEYRNRVAAIHLLYSPCV